MLLYSYLYANDKSKCKHLKQSEQVKMWWKFFFAEKDSKLVIGENSIDDSTKVDKFKTFVSIKLF